MKNFDQVYNELFKSVFAYIMCRVKNESAAEDIAAKSWQKVLENFDKYNTNKGTYEQYIFTIARNEINAHYRMAYVKKFLSLTDYEEDITDQSPWAENKILKEEERQLLSNAFKVLDKREMEIISLKFYSSLNNRQIAALTNIGESNVGTIAHRATTKLKAIMEP